MESNNKQWELKKLFGESEFSVCELNAIEIFERLKCFDNT
jgi:hypothetical protein